MRRSLNGQRIGPNHARQVRSEGRKRCGLRHSPRLRHCYFHPRQDLRRLVDAHRRPGGAIQHTDVILCCFDIHMPQVLPDDLDGARTLILRNMSIAPVLEGRHFLLRIKNTAIYYAHVKDQMSWFANLRLLSALAGPIAIARKLLSRQNRRTSKRACGFAGARLYAS